MKPKIREWIKRYLPAEILSSVATLVVSWIAFHFTGDQLITALTGTWAGNVAFFGFIFFLDVVKTRKKYLADGLSYRFSSFLKNIQALALEFGAAEILDSFFIRPALMYYMPVWMGSLMLGIFLAKLIADIVFYVPSIIGYELSKKYLQP